MRNRTNASEFFTRSRETHPLCNSPTNDKTKPNKARVLQHPALPRVTLQFHGEPHPPLPYSTTGCSNALISSSEAANEVPFICPEQAPIFCYLGNPLPASSLIFLAPRTNTRGAPLGVGELSQQCAQLLNASPHSSTSREKRPSPAHTDCGGAAVFRFRPVLR